MADGCIGENDIPCVHCSEVLMIFTIISLSQHLSTTSCRYMSPHFFRAASLMAWYADSSSLNIFSSISVWLRIDWGDKQMSLSVLLIYLWLCCKLIVLVRCSSTFHIKVQNKGSVYSLLKNKAKSYNTIHFHVPIPRSGFVAKCYQFGRCCQHFGPTYLQVFSDGVVGSMGGQQDPIGLADQPVSLFDLPCVPVDYTSSHDGHA